MIDYCNFKGIGVLVYSPLMDGHLARPVGAETARTKIIAGSFLEKPRRESDKQISRRVEELAKKKGVSMAQISIAWSLSKDGTSCVRSLVYAADAVRHWAYCSRERAHRWDDEPQAP